MPKALDTMNWLYLLLLLWVFKLNIYFSNVHTLEWSAEGFYTSQYIDLVKKFKKWYFAEVSRLVGSDLAITVYSTVTKAGLSVPSWIWSKVHYLLFVAVRFTLNYAECLLAFSQ